MENDTISRAAAIDAVRKNTFRLTFAEKQNCEGHVAWSAEAVYSDVMEGALLELPSAQPDPCYDEWCTECKEYDQATNNCPRWNNVIKNTISDIEATCVRLDTFLSLDDYDITPESVEDEGGTVKWGIRIRRKEHV